jgi:hypothetical protein
MDNGNRPANPAGKLNSGLTKRELFALQLMGPILARMEGGHIQLGENKISPFEAAVWSADQLLAALAVDRQKNE